MRKQSLGASAPGIIGGVAGLLTALVALVGLLVQLGVIGGGDSKSKDSGVTSSGGSETTDAATPTFSVKPTALALTGLAPEAKVVVTNTGETALSVEAPDLQGPGANQFAVGDETCTDRQIRAGATCDVAVTFTPKGVDRYTAKLVISVKGASKVSEVTLDGKPV